MKYKLIFIILIYWQLNIISQSQNPPDILWNSLKSEHFKVIFPAEIENEAQRVANTLEWAYNYDTKTLNIRPKPISIVLYNRTTNSNAYAALAPRRMGWYLCPPQSVTSLGSIDWVQTLAIHEYRHVVQYAKNRQNFTKFMSVLFGDMGQSMMRWSIPDWFFEGDAIVMETALTKGGRGRMPEFSLNLRTFALNDVKFSYDQAYIGSYRRYYPSHYHLGYPLAAYGRVKYGADIWDKVLERTSKISFWPFAFGSSLKKYTGLNVKKFYKAGMAEFKNEWEKQAKELKTTDARIVNTKRKKNWTNYYNPQYDADGNIICGKESLDKIPALYIVMQDGKEKKIKNTDAGIFNVNNQKVIWDRSISDIRWGEQNFNPIILFDLETGKEKSLGKKKKYLSPALSPDGKKIAVVEYNTNQEIKLCILDAENGKELSATKIDDNDYIRTPVWSENGEYVAFTHAKKEGPALSVLNIESGSIIKIIDYNWENIGRPVFYKNYILYNSSYSGIGNIFACDINNGQKYQITSRPYGAYNADVSPDNSKIVFQDYDKNGFNLAEMELKPENWIKIQEISSNFPDYYKPLIEQEGGKSIDETQISENKYPVTKYKKIKDAIKLHSWGIYPYLPYLEFNLFSNNYLNTFAAQAGYLYNTNEKTSTGYLAFSYSGYFPVFTIVSSYGERKDIYDLTDAIYKDSWEEFQTNFSVSLPFNFSRNVYHTNLTLKGAYGYVYTLNKSDYRYLSDFPDGGFNQLSFGLNFNHTRQYAWRDFYPKWGQTLAVDYKLIPGSDIYEGSLLSARANLYFPGLLPQNSIKLGGSFEKQLTFNPDDYNGSYYFSSLSAFPRGYTSYTYDEFYKLSADYQLPLWYPDISIGPLAYVKRFRAGAFFDYAHGYWGPDLYKYQSFGGSLVMEFYLFRYRYPFEIGLQYAYRPNDAINGKKYDISILIFGLPF